MKRGRQKIRWLDGITDSMDMGLGGLRELLMDREVCRDVVHGTLNIFLNSLQKSYRIYFLK